MAEHKNFFGKLIAGIFSIFKSSAAKIWDTLTPEEQDSLKHGSGVVAIINSHLTDAPAIIIEEIQAQFPDLDINYLSTELIAIANHLGIVTNINLTVEEAITAIQTYLSSKTGPIWEWASSSLAELIAIALTPNTIFAKISMLVEYVYRTYINKP